jgi:hypothetical protein
MRKNHERKYESNELKNQGEREPISVARTFRHESEEASGTIDTQVAEGVAAISAET